MKTTLAPDPSKTRSSYPIAVGEMQGARRASEISPTAKAAAGNRSQDPPDPEVPETVPRRRFTAAFKLRILQQADQCTQPGEIGALLRREGLYSSHLATWRRQRAEGLLIGLAPKRRGRKKKPVDPSAEKISRLEKENQRLKQQLRRAEIIIDAQKKISEILGIEQNPEDNEEGK
jgi:transposase-like protein